MKQVASLQYDVIFKKAFSKPEIFKAFVKAVLGIDLEITEVETEKNLIFQSGGWHHGLIYLHRILKTG